MSNGGNVTGATAEARQRMTAWRRTVVISFLAVAAFASLRALPLSGGSLHYTDFKAADGTNFLEFCAPGTPQFAPVARVRSPVTLDLTPAAPIQSGRATAVEARLITSSDKPIGPEDLLTVHERKLHLLVVDPSLDDYQHIHPEYDEEREAFVFDFAPLRAGNYRFFADFTPRATGRALYAGAELASDGDAAIDPASPAKHLESARVVVGNIEFRLKTDPAMVRINRPAEVELSVSRSDGGAVELQNVMGAPAHLVAFDAERSGFAHLHPAPVEGGSTPGPTGGEAPLKFTLLLNDPGYYRVWAQVKIDGREMFAPFGLSARP